MYRTVMTLIFFAVWATAQGVGQTTLADYGQARRVFWRSLYADGGETLYCAERFGNRPQRGLNIEHVFPMGWATKAFGCATRKQCRRDRPAFNRLEADLHNLYPARTDINKARGSLAFGLVKGEPRAFGRCDFEKRGRAVEPRAAVRGEIARAMFYMHDTYGLVIYKKAGALLKQWHQADPPTDVERRRNERIAAIQGTRNRYIDDPALADALRF